MKIKYYEDADLLSIRVSKKLFYDAVQEGDVIVHYAKDREPVLIEILNAAKFLKDTDESLSKKVRHQIWPGIANIAIPHQIRK